MQDLSGSSRLSSDSSLPPQQGQPSPTGPQHRTGVRASGPLSSQPAPPRTHRYLAQTQWIPAPRPARGALGRPWLRLPWEQTLASHAADLGVGGRGVSWGRRKTQEKRESREMARELGAGSALGEGVSDFWRPTSGGRCGTGSGRFRRGAGGGHGRSPAATSSSLPPPHPAAALQVRLLTLKSCRSEEPPPAPSSSQLSRAPHLPLPRHSPRHTHSLGQGAPARGID